MLLAPDIADAIVDGRDVGLTLPIALGGVAEGW